MAQEEYTISPEKLAELSTAYKAVQSLLPSVGGQPALTMRYEAAKAQLYWKVEMLMKAWPVPVSDGQADAITNALNELRSALEEVNMRSHDKSADRVIQVEQFAYRIDDLKFRIIAGAQSILIQELEGKRDEVQSSINGLNAVAKDKVNKHSLEQQSTYYSKQASWFGWVAGASLATFMVLCGWFICRFVSFPEVRPMITGGEAFLGPAGPRNAWAGQGLHSTDRSHEKEQVHRTSGHRHAQAA